MPKKRNCIANAKNKKNTCIFFKKLHCRCRCKNKEKLAFPIAKSKKKLHSHKVEIIKASFLK